MSTLIDRSSYLNAQDKIEVGSVGNVSAASRRNDKGYYADGGSCYKIVLGVHIMEIWWGATISHIRVKGALNPCRGVSIESLRYELFKCCLNQTQRNRNA